MVIRTFTSTAVVQGSPAALAEKDVNTSAASVVSSDAQDRLVIDNDTAGGDNGDESSVAQEVVQDVVLEVVIDSGASLIWDLIYSN